MKHLQNHEDGITATFAIHYRKETVRGVEEGSHSSIGLELLEGFGCGDAIASSIFEIIIMQSWSITPPLLSVLIYCRTSFLTDSGHC